MNKPPEIIDGAEVIEWAWSGAKPFGVFFGGSDICSTSIYGLAICQYSNSDVFYRFSCNEKWETEQDSCYDTIDEAKEKLPRQYQGVLVNWQRIREDT